MVRRYSGAGDPARSLELLWRAEAGSARAPGPRPALSVAGIVAAAVRRADADGLAAVSMRRLAESLGVGTMTLYTYVPGKAELTDLMVDAAHAELYPVPPWDAAEGWRARLALVARENWALHRRHAWLLHLDLSRAPLGPHSITKYEHELRTVDGLGLSDVEMDAVVALVAAHAQTSARAAADAEHTRRDSGLTEHEWWQAWGPRLAQILDAERFPTAARVGSAVGAAFQAAADPEHAFEFGLGRILDGIGDLIAERSADGP